MVLSLDSKDSLGEVSGSLGDSSDGLLGLLRGQASSNGAGLLGSKLLGNELLTGKGLTKLRREEEKHKLMWINEDKHTIQANKQNPARNYKIASFPSHYISAEINKYWRKCISTVLNTDITDITASDKTI